MFTHDCHICCSSCAQAYNGCTQDEEGGRGLILRTFKSSVSAKNSTEMNVAAGGGKLAGAECAGKVSL